MELCIVCGARPNFIKVAPLIRAIKTDKECQPSAETAVDMQFVYTGAEDDPTLDKTLFRDLDIPHPDTFLGVTATNLSDITGQVMQKFEIYLQQHPVDTVVVVDDLASTMAVAIVTKKHGIRLAHIAAGTRSFDINMPKEVNRLVIDGLSDILFTAGASNSSIANREGAELSKIYMVGNILMDNLRFIHDKLQKPAIIEKSGLKGNDYIVFTLNRRKLIANKENLSRMIRAIISNAGPIPVIAPLRQSASQVVSECLNEDHLKTFLVVDSLPYLSFSWLTANAKAIITDSGNVAEEATFNHVPCITLNSYTEHIETIKIGTNILVGEDAQLLGKAVADVVVGNWKEGALPDRWDGRSAERMLRILRGEKD
ncbi:UDP-N-acetyl glucosamine 2-epimerase [Hallella multisaccharivorax DSM 17128]|uniref:UDP-N-acetylglucosamine 2-epimerase n=1 Tax=Hallella multisaccharivorax DSM 17128 TaxID=688246 RepID=F8N9S7_9BACT|nr:UDP-N-acetylglucosamine 2-epimerase [Hallella multisaccharivorax]EGN56719.1 UDP-N-acetylglucosamine 2-epimerase [Hallella multisaccharivorax DSM 17128]GJG30256.1 UDP-N-acetyl glucosamine 2-epimerase [Hallella multisaccharivorax DSM 17128]